ncbi:unnamed protein product [Cuscuta epithymum]|uniref:Uncharacterized protein n=1 Tax=Cuscuta epithymum TaxID=186058 RepID=A0AAV0E217_9ASTE|nr:unnamed protein product [Cuscuta epithymum]
MAKEEALKREEEEVKEAGVGPEKKVEDDSSGDEEGDVYDEELGKAKSSTVDNDGEDVESGDEDGDEDDDEDEEEEDGDSGEEEEPGIQALLKPPEELENEDSDSDFELQENSLEEEEEVEEEEDDEEDEPGSGGKVEAPPKRKRAAKDDEEEEEEEEDYGGEAEKVPTKRNRSGEEALDGKVKEAAKGKTPSNVPKV